jgi:membrane-associated phospholipid phosphatase
LFPQHRTGWPILFVVHLTFAALLWGTPVSARIGRALTSRFPRTFELLADWYPLLLIPALYTELAFLNVAVWNGTYFDSLVQQWEAFVFGGQPSRELAARFPIPLLSEALHAGYLSYYLIIYIPAIILYLRGRRAEFRTMVFTMMLAFFGHYVFFIYFPVQGPRYLFPAPNGALSDGPMYRLAHLVLEAGSSRGAAFPSSHVGVAFTQTILAFRFLPGLAPVVAVLSCALALGAVYGGFHYAIDALAGLLLAALALAAAPVLRRLLSPAPSAP